MMDFKVFLKGKPVTLKINKINISECYVTHNIKTSDNLSFKGVFYCSNV